MDAAEYDNLEALERHHWYYVGKRDLVSHWLNRWVVLSSATTLLDCGAGTGRFAEEIAGMCEVYVLDDHEESLERLRRKFPEDRVLRVSATGIPMANDRLDVITALDVLEHIENDRGAVVEMRRVLKPGGVLVVTVPASMALWSDWDESLHHFRRYDRRALLALFPENEWEILHVNHTNVLVFPGVWLLRRWRRWLPGGTQSKPRQRSEDRIPPSWLNRLLQTTFVGLGKSRFRFPFGVSLLLAARKR